MAEFLRNYYMDAYFWLFAVFEGSTACLEEMNQSELSHFSLSKWKSKSCAFFGPPTNK